MEILSFEGSNGSSKRKRSSKFIAIATIAALGFMGSTFAASITLNGNSDIQYGQGVSQAVSCASDLIITPSNTFNGTQFNLETITVLDSSTVTTASNAGLGNCTGKTINVKTYNSSNAVLWTCDVLVGAYSAPNLGATGVSGACPTTTVASAAGTNNKGFSIRWTGTAINAANVAKISLESKN
jgi:hypothetical protein